MSSKISRKNIAYFGYNLKGTANWGCLSTPQCLLNIIENKMQNINITTKISNFNTKIMDRDSSLENIVKAHDTIIINGEGSPIFKTPVRKDFQRHMRIIEYSLKHNKKILYLNTMISACPQTGINKKTYARALNLWSKCNLVTVRDSSSLSFLSGLSNSFYVPDALFTWSQDIDDIKKEKYICLSGGSYPLHLNQNTLLKIKIYTEIVRYIREYFEDLEIKVVQTCKADEWLGDFAKKQKIELIPFSTELAIGFEVLRNAKLFISGRFHPSIMASIGGCPCIHFISNSDKTTYLQNILGYDNPKSFAINTESLPEIFKLINFYLDNKNVYKKIFLRSKFLSTKCLSDYEKLLKNI
jgi:polysaccharide pyruvyl transferase WcaK-like protein